MINELANYQILIFVICIFFILNTFQKFLRKKKTFRELLLAVFIWGGFSIIGIFPQVFDLLATITGFHLGVNAILVIAVLILLYATGKQSMRNYTIENSITKMVRRDALKKFGNYENQQ